MADVEYLKGLLGVHPDWPKKVLLLRLLLIVTCTFSLTL